MRRGIAAVLVGIVVTYILAIRAVDIPRDDAVKIPAEATVHQTDRAAIKRVVLQFSRRYFVRNEAVLAGTPRVRLSRFRENLKPFVVESFYGRDRTTLTSSVDERIKTTKGKLIVGVDITIVDTISRDKAVVGITLQNLLLIRNSGEPSFRSARLTVVRRPAAWKVLAVN